MSGLPDAVLFDMDGLILDSERLYLEAFGGACEAHGYPFERAVYLQLICTPDDEARAILLRDYGDGFPVDAVSALAAERYRARVAREPVPLKAGALELLSFLEACGVPRAVVTSTETALAQHKLRLAGVLDAFAFVLGADQVLRPKPAPDPYEAACARLGVAPARALALEDSENGVRSALAAGLEVVQVPDLKAPSAAFLCLGHEVRASLTEVLRGLEPTRAGV